MHNDPQRQPMHPNIKIPIKKLIAGYDFLLSGFTGETLI